MGILQAKEFVSEVEISKIDWTELIRSIVKLNPNKPILSALKKLQESKSHLGIVINDKGLLGIVTMEDIFEEVVGDIYDEDDDIEVLLSATPKFRAKQ